MGRMKKRYIEARNIDDYIKNKFVEEIKDISFSPDEDIFRLNIKRKKKETKIEFRKRQNRRIKKFVETYLHIFKDGKDKPIKLIRQQVLLIADVFYKRKRNKKTANKVIVWASRGGGKGVTISIIIFLLMIWKNKSFIDLAGAQDQAMIVYEYTANFLTRCIPVVREKLLDGEPLQKKTKLKNGVSLKCIANSPTQTRGKHPPGLVCDEACQKDTGKDENVRSAINMVFSEEDFSILIMSTFHVPIGIFQEYWDEADAKGFVKYKWDIYDTAVKCTLPDKCTFCNGRDKSCKFCKGKGKIKCKECFLTKKEKEFDIDGNLIGFSYGGCNGRCLTSEGYTPIENLFAAKSINDPETYTTEFECHRPRTKGPVYDLEAAYDCFKNNDEIEIPDYETLSTVGIDWGYAGQTSVIGPAINCGDHVSIIREAYFIKPSITEIVGCLRQLEMLYGKFVIFADSSHPFENRSLEDAGFDLWHDRHRQGKDSGVVFSRWKDWGIGNIRKWFDKRKLKISWQSCNELWQYIKIYKMGDDGKPVKKMDHGPDALLCAMLGHPYVEELLVPKTDEEKKRRSKQSNNTVLKFGGKGDEKTRKKN